MQDKRIKANQLEFQIREYNNDGETIIFLHYGSGNLMIWDQSIPSFQNKYHLVLIDLRGHGKSDIPETGYHIDTMASDVTEIMKSLNIEKAHIIGSSLGAEVGLSIAANSPEKVISFVCEGALYSEFGQYGIWEGTADEYDKHVTELLEKVQNIPETVYPSIDAMVGETRKKLKKNGFWNKRFEPIIQYSATKKAEDEYTAANMGFKGFIEYMTHYYRYQFENYFKKVQCPVLMIPSKEELEDKNMNTAMEGLKNLTKSCKIVEINGWEHAYGWVLMPEKICPVVLDFLKN